MKNITRIITYPLIFFSLLLPNFSYGESPKQRAGNTPQQNQYTQKFTDGVKRFGKGVKDDPSIKIIIEDAKAIGQKVNREIERLSELPSIKERFDDAHRRKVIEKTGRFFGLDGILIEMDRATEKDGFYDRQRERAEAVENSRRK